MAEEPERNMLFDLRGRRKRVIQVIYVILAIIMAASLVVIGLPGGINPFGNAGTGGNSDIAKANLERAEDLETKLETQPNNKNATVELIRARFSAAQSLYETDQNTGQTAITDEATTQAVLASARALGKEPVVVADYPGFVANRVLMPMINEAAFALMEGVADAEGIDTVMKLGMNHPMGPLTLADFIGLDVCLSILEVLHEGFGDPRYRPCPLLRRMVAAGHLGRKSGRGFYAY